MLRKLGEQVQMCFDRALDAKRKAERTDDLAQKAGFLEMEKHWLVLARSYEFSERLTDFTASNEEWRRRFDEQAQARNRPDDTSRLQKIIQERNVDVLFERMWLASIVESSDDAIVSKNLNGIITSWNEGAHRVFGYSAKEVIGKPIIILIPPDRHHEEKVILDHIRRGERVEHYETIRRRKDGSLIDVSLTISPIRGAQGKIVAASKIARDITAQKCAERLLQRQADLLDQSHDAILSWKIGGGITYWSRGAEDLYGYTPRRRSGVSATSCSGLVLT
jgi:PAS domain S-box-containing protein